jgi:hypothetical protein
MNPVCSKCHVEMSCKKSGVTVAPVMMPGYCHSGDEFICKSCGATVIINFGQPYDSDIEADVLVAETL